jgi:dethiobiotin synthetase
MRYFVTAIHTDSGKTLTSAILCEALGADYWKPVQCGAPRDSEMIESLVTNLETKIHKEGIFLETPASPHAAANAEGVRLEVERFVLPETQNKNLIIEGAGGCLVPLNDHQFIIDLAVKFEAKVILVSNLYLGSVNHTLLTWECLQNRKIPVEGIIFNGVTNAQSEKIILHHTRLPVLLRIKPENKINQEIINHYAGELRTQWSR